MNLACPACEYERNSRGRPSVEGNIITCLDCGTSWKELGADLQLAGREKTKITDSSNALIDPRVFNSRHFEKRDTDINLTSSHTDEKIHNTASWPTARKSDGLSWKNASIVICCLVAGFAVWGVFGNTALNGVGNLSSSWSRVQLDDVVMREVRNSFGNRVITVEGSLSNPASSGQTVPTIEIILRRANGEEIHRWLHNPPLAKMKPQSNARFVSSIQHDNARIAYAEAEFVD